MSVQQQQQDVTGRGGSENSGSMSDDERGSRARQTSGDLQAGSGPLDDAASRKSKLTRIHQACVNCGLKKQKCTGEQPCQPCRSANLECEYKQAKKRGPPKGTKRVRKHSNADEVGLPSSLSGEAPIDAGRAGSAKAAPGSARSQSIALKPGSTASPYSGSQNLHLPKDAGEDRSPNPTTGTLPSRSQPSTTHLQPLTYASEDAQTVNHSALDFALTALGQSQTISSLDPSLQRLLQHRDPSSPSASYDALLQQQQHPFQTLQTQPPLLGLNQQANGFATGQYGSTLPDSSLRDAHQAARSQSSSQSYGRGLYAQTNSAREGEIEPNLIDPGLASMSSPSSLAPAASTGARDGANSGRREPSARVKREPRDITSDVRAALSGARRTEDLDSVSSMSEHFRGATSGIPSLHARRAYHYDDADPHHLSHLGKRPRSRSLFDDPGHFPRSDFGPDSPGSYANGLRNHALANGYEPRSPAASRLRLSSQHPATSGSHIAEVERAYAETVAALSAGSAAGPGTVNSAAASAKRDVQALVDHIDQFTLPPIRLPSLAHNIDPISTSSLGLYIPRGLFDRLISYYFAISHHSCPIIYKPDVDIANIHTQLPQLLLDGMCCLAARFIENDDLAQFFPLLRGVDSDRFRTAREQIEQHYYDRARRQIQEDDYRSDVTTVQALLLLAKRDNGSGRMLHCWQLVGSATRMVIDLGLHRQSTMMSKNTETTYGQIETRRRVFWQSYIMDKHAAASLGRPVFLREEDIDVLLPSEVAADEFERWAGYYPFSQPNQPPPENRAISTHNAFARLSIILQSIINDVYSTRARKNHFEISPGTGEYMCYVVLRELYGQLQNWKTTLPNHLQWNPGSNQNPPLPHQLLLHAFYYTCLLLVFRPVVPVSNQVSFPNQHKIPRPHDVCTSAANSIMTIMDVYEQSYGLQRVPSSTAVYYIFTAATIYVGNSSSSNPKIYEQANANLDKCIRLLDHLSEACCAASQHREILLDITSLGSTKLKSRDDAEDLLSSRVPNISSPNSQTTAEGQTPASTSGRSAVNGAASSEVSQQPRPIKRGPHHLQQQQEQEQQRQQQQQQQVQQAQQQSRHQQALLANQTQNQPQQVPDASPASTVASHSQGIAGFATSWDDIGGIASSSSAASGGLTGTDNQRNSGDSGSNVIAPFTTSSNPNHTLSAGDSGFSLSEPQHHSVPSFYSSHHDLASAHNSDNINSNSTNNDNSANPFDFSLSAMTSSNNPAMTNQADLAFWREMPIGCADPGDWNIFTDSYAQQLMTAIPQLSAFGSGSSTSAGMGNGAHGHS